MAALRAKLQIFYAKHNASKLLNGSVEKVASYFAVAGREAELEASLVKEYGVGLASLPTSNSASLSLPALPNRDRSIDVPKIMRGPADSPTPKHDGPKILRGPAGPPMQFRIPTNETVHGARAAYTVYNLTCEKDAREWRVNMRYLFFFWLFFVRRTIGAGTHTALVLWWCYGKRCHNAIVTSYDAVLCRCVAIYIAIYGANPAPSHDQHPRYLAPASRGPGPGCWSRCDVATNSLYLGHASRLMLRYIENVWVMRRFEVHHCDR